MARSLPKTLLLFAFLGTLCPAAPAAGPARTVIVVRHADRAGGMTPGAGLSQAGVCRAGVLARILGDAGVDRIYVTEVERTQQTAQPLATKLHLQPVVVPAADIDGLIARLRADPPGGAALVVAHGNTLPEIVSRLGGGKVAPLADTEYDRLYVITMDAPAQPTVLLLRYPGCGE